MSISLQLTIVSTCSTVYQQYIFYRLTYKLSANIDCPFCFFQQTLRDLGAVPMLQSLTNSKHSTIATCSTGALKNLLSTRPAIAAESSPEDVGGHPSLHARKLKNLAKDLDEKLLTETFDDQADEDESSEGDSDSGEVLFLSLAALNESKMWH